jgi:hypothetical protein
MPQAGVLTAGLLLGIVCFLVVKLGHRVYRRTRLGVFENGLRFGRSLIRFNELKVVTFGAPKAGSKRHMPTFSKIQRAIEKPAVRRVREIRERSQKLSLTLMLHDGKIVVWQSVMGLFTKESLDEFFVLLDQHAHDQLRGLSLSDEEWRAAEDL